MIGFLFKLSDLVFGDNWFGVALTFILSAILTFFPTDYVVAKVSNNLKKSRSHLIAAIISFVIGVVFISYLSYINHSYYRFPDIIGIKRHEAIELISDRTDGNKVVQQPDDFTDNDNSYVFEIETEVGSRVFPNDILKNDEKIYLYTTFDKNKIDLYREGTLAKDDLKEDTLVSITAEYIGVDIFVGGTINKSDINVIAHYSSKKTSKIDISECKLSGTAISKPGDNIVTVTWNDLETRFTVTAHKPTLVDIAVKYTGDELVEGDQVDSDDFSVEAFMSNGVSIPVSADEFTVAPSTVERGDNEVVVTYATKKKSCKVHALGQDEAHKIIESEPNDKSANATIVRAPCNISGKMSTVSDIDMYEIKIIESGQLRIHVDSSLEYTNISLYKEMASDPIWKPGSERFNQDLGALRIDYSLNLSSGIYYLKVTGREYDDGDSTIGAYTLNLDFVSSNCTYLTPHAISNKAIGIQFDEDVYDQISLTERSKYYSFELDTYSKITLEVNSYMPYVSWWLYNEKSSDYIDSKRNVGRENLDYVTNIYEIYLNPGSYLIVFSGADYDADKAYNTGNYNFNVKKTECKVSSVNQLGQSLIYGIIPVDETMRKYDMNLPSDKAIDILCESDSSITLKIVSDNGDRQYSNSLNSASLVFENIKLSAGHYVVILEKQQERGAAFSLRYSEHSE